MARKVSLEQEKEIISKYLTNTGTELAEEYNLAPSTIRSIWRRNGCNGKVQKWKPENNEEFSEYYLTNGATKTARYYNKDRHLITNYAKELGIYKKKEPLLSNKQIQYVIDNYNTKTARSLSEELGVSQSRIFQIWRNNHLIGKVNRSYYLNEDYFEKINTDEKAYWVGFIMSDGCIYHPDTKKIS